jgi:hypothetical protein
MVPSSSTRYKAASTWQPTSFAAGAVKVPRNASLSGRIEQLNSSVSSRSNAARCGSDSCSFPPGCMNARVPFLRTNRTRRASSWTSAATIRIRFFEAWSPFMRVERRGANYSSGPNINTSTAPRLGRVAPTPMRWNVSGRKKSGGLTGFAPSAITDFLPLTGRARLSAANAGSPDGRFLDAGRSLR